MRLHLRHRIVDCFYGIYKSKFDKHSAKILDIYWEVLRLFPVLLKFFFNAFICSILLSSGLTIAESRSQKNESKEQGLIILDGSTESIELSPYVQYFRTYQHFNPKDFLTLEAPWKLFQGETLSFGYSDQTFWFRTNLTHVGYQEQGYYLEFSYPLLDQLAVTLFENEQMVQHFEAGDHLPVDNRVFQTPTFLFPINLKPDHQYTLVFKVKSSSSIQVPVTLWSRDSYTFGSQSSLLMLGFFYGILGLALIYNLFIYFTTRNIRFLLYCFYVASFTLFQASLHGLTPLYLWPNSHFLTNYSIPILVSLTNITFLLFAVTLLEIKRYWPTLYQIARYIIVLAAFPILVVGFIPYQHSTQIATLLVMVMSIFVIFSSIVRIREGSGVAKFLLFAFSTLLIGTLMLSFNKLGLLPRNPVTENGQLIGALCEVILLSFLLGNQMNRLQRDKMKIQEQARAQLEEKVQERTNELQKSLTQVSSLAQKLSDLSSTDPLTDLKNRRYLDDQLSKEWNRLQRTEGGISVIIADIDHFKKINDTHGHVIGDQCLVELAEVLKNSVKRPTDIVARYGGEEFVIVLTDTAIHGAVAVANQIMENTQSIAIKAKRESIKFTLSFGLAHLYPTRDNSYSSLIDLADKALYSAKESGRNRIKIFHEGLIVDRLPKVNG